MLERHANGASRRYLVNTTDGRRFALRQDVTSGDWELAGAMAAAAK